MLFVLTGSRHPHGGKSLVNEDTMNIMIEVNASTHTIKWRDFVKATYPDILTKTCCVPPFHFNRVPYSRVPVPGIPTDLRALVSQHPIGAFSGPNGQPAAPQPSQTTNTLSSVQQTTDSTATSNQADTATATPSADGGTHSQTVPDTTPQSSSPSSNLPPSSPSVPPPPLSEYSLWPAHTSPPAGTPTPVYLSDASDDFSQQYLLYHLQALATRLGEVMFILSSVGFTNYLNSPSVASGQFPRPRDLRKDMQGDFDFLIIHRRRGILVGELKSVGRLRAELNLSQGKDDDSVVTKVEKGAKQLEKERDVVSHLVSDVHSGLPVHTALFLPFVSRSQLLRVLSAQPALAQKVCQSLHVNTSQEAVDVTLCSDDLQDPADYWEITPQVYSQLTSWWQRRTVPCSAQQLSDDQYVDIVGRFVGPATTVSIHCNARPRITVEVRTEGEALAELGMRLARLVLTPEQVDLLTRAPPRVYLTGPPGTGKSVMLILMALVWVHRGWNVQVVSLDEDSMAACQLVYHQIRKTLESHSGDGATVGQVSLQFFRLHNDDIWLEKVSAETAAKKLTEGAQGKPLAIIMDELPCNYEFTELLRMLRQTNSNLHLWGANIRKETPEGLQRERMTRPLRSAPCVVQHIQRAVMSRQYRREVDPYSTDGIPSPADGLNASVIVHDGQNHTSESIASCYQCGVEVARALRGVGVGNTGHLVPNSPDSLQFRDVFILAARGNETAHDVLKDPEGLNILSASKLICGLRDEGLHVCVLENRLHVEDLEEEHRWQLHTSKGCTLPKAEPEEFGLMLDGLFGTEEEEDTTWEPGTDAWRQHFAVGCEVESEEREGQWAACRQKAREEWRCHLADMATARQNEVVVTTDSFVQGLERKVVVALMSSMTSFFATDRMGCISRCTTHLIIVRNGRASTDPTDTSAGSDEEYAKYNCPK